MSDAIRRAARAAFPDRTVESIETQNTRPGNRTARVTFEAERPVYIKTATDDTTRLVRETAVTQYAARHCEVGVPTVAAASPTGDPPYLATEPLPGTVFNERWTDGYDREELLRRVGHVVAGVHEARFQQPGVIAGGDADGLDLAGETWTDVLCETVEWRAEDWFADRFSDMPERLVETIREFEPTFEAAPTLIHGDPSRINIHLDPDGLLDWERALVGDPAFGLVDAAFHHTGQPDVDDEERPALIDALHEGYRARAGSLPESLERNRPLYRAISYLLVPQAFEDWSEDADVPKDELAAEVREEFDARLTETRKAA